MSFGLIKKINYTGFMPPRNRSQSFLFESAILICQAKAEGKILLALDVLMAGYRKTCVLTV